MNNLIQGLVLSSVVASFLFADEKPINYDLRGQSHSKTNIKYNKNGYPIFDTKFNHKLPQDLYKASNEKQFKKATLSLQKRIQNNPSFAKNFTKQQLTEIKQGNARITNLTWHHSQKKGVLELVSRDLHNRTAHSGGRTLWGGGYQAQSIINKPTRASTVKKITNLITKSSKYGGSSAVKRGLKVTAMSVASAIPFVGVVAQVALDVYMMNEIDNIGIATEDNQKLIGENRDFIIQNGEEIEKNRDFLLAIEKEQKILGLIVDENTHNITKIVTTLLLHEEKFQDINIKLTNMEGEVAKNTQDIKEIKDAPFTVGLKKLDEYYQSENLKDVYLGNAIAQFEETIKSNNETFSNLAKYYLVIARYEQYLNKKENNDLKEMKLVYKSFVSSIKKDKEHLNLLNSLYLLISDVESQFLEEFRTPLTELTEEIVNNKLKLNLFDDAQVIMEKYTFIVNLNKDENILYQKILDAKKENFKQYRDGLTIKEKLALVENNQNSLLLEKVVHALYLKDNFDNTLYILKNHKFINKDFQLKHFLAIYEATFDQIKLKKLVNLVLNNENYSKEIKDFAKGVGLDLQQN